jgi:uncharacterized protein YqgQ
MCFTRVFKIVTPDDVIHYFRDRKEALEFMRDYLQKPTLKITSVDNYFHKKNMIPSSVKEMEVLDLYEFLKDDIKRVYGDSLNNSCSKTIQKKSYTLFDDLYKRTVC